MNAFVERPCIGFLYSCGVLQHYCTEVSSCGSGKNCSLKALLYQVGDKPRVVDVGVRQNQVIYFAWLKSKLSVEAVSFQTLALIHSAVQKNFLSFWSGNQMFAARNFFCSTQKLYLHIKSILFRYRTAKVQQTNDNSSKKLPKRTPAKIKRRFIRLKRLFDLL